ncbi:MAG: 16S rRNA (cytosine(1402)-N(4))-methyltransferase [Zetaproteobacteria bacterium]|nr:16S rRNA (cytosine(1402)-N(4))-methyltransferase [Pseudobdellovibrionaceae bacterium]|tara:strand:+ start:440 stop:1387 length:948 start_codon:yes stop_codon:yes gene_type:complete
MKFHHITVLKRQTVDALNLQPGDIAIDCTAGGGGHTELMLEATGKNGKVFALDQDQTAIDHLHEKFSNEIKQGSLEIIKSNFGAIAEICREHRIVGKVSGIAADIGISSHQIDTADRGFSFQSDGPLDMRMDKNRDLTAADIVNSWEQEDLIDIFRRYGEEPKAIFGAKGIIEFRKTSKISTTSQLAEILAKSIHYKTRSRKHPATKIFQALRIAVNNELGELELLLGGGLQSLKSGGRLSVISFHSLEDRIIKQYYKQQAGLNKKPILRDLPVLPEKTEEYAKIIKPFPQTPDENELQINPRSRSAKLRTLEKV